MVQQAEFTLSPRGRGFHLVTPEVMSHLPQLPQVGLLHLFVRHTSCALAINENWDPDVRGDMERIYDRLVRENEPTTRIRWRAATTCRHMRRASSQACR